MIRGSVIFILAYVLLIASGCKSRSGCSNVEGESYERAVNGGMLIIGQFSNPIFINNDYTFEQLLPYPSPKSNNQFYPFFNDNYDYEKPLNHRGIIALPTDREEFSFIINYKDSIKDTLTLRYKNSIVFVDDFCVGEYYYVKVNLSEYQCTNHFVKPVYIY